MARRRKSSEVLITGDKVDPRERFRTKTPSAAKPPRAEIMAPKGPGGKYEKVADGGVDRSDPIRRKRKKPKVIDARRDPEETEGQSWDTDAAPAPEPEAAPETELKSTPEPDTAPVEAPEPEAEMAPMDTPAPKPVPEVAPVEEPPEEKAPEPVVEAAPKPPPKPAKKTDRPTRPASAKEQSQVLAKTAVSSMVEKMRAEVKRKGSLSIDDIVAMSGEFDKPVAELTSTFEQSFEDYVQARERADWDQKRDYPFDRLVVKRFSHLFNETDMTRFDRVSRRMLPGFFMALNMFLGPEAVEEYQGKCRLIVERLREKLGDGFDWEDAYAAKDARTLVLDALMGVALQFEDFDRRSEWFMELVNGHLTPADESEREDARWEITPGGVKHFLNAFLDDLRTVLGTPQGKNHMARRHGPDSVRIAQRVFNRIDS